jgi:nucleotide-binding universal stress UspA family protein
VGTIVVGVDGSEGSLEGLRWAAAEARLRGDRLVAVHAWSAAYVSAAPGMMEPAFLPVERGPIEEAAKEALDASLREVGTALEGIDVERAVVEDSAAGALLDRAQDADLLVVGSRGHGRIAGALLGSVSQKCAHHARCPVVIVHPPKND